MKDASTVTGRNVRLTPRQYEVLGLIAQRYTSKEVGRHLDLSPKTVDRHVEEAVARLGVSNRAEAARLFLEGQGRSGEEFPMGAAIVDPSSPEPPDHRQPAVAEPTNDNQADGVIAVLKHLFRLPPVGGKRHEMMLAERGAAVAQIALVSLLFVAAVITLITGILHLING